MEYLRKTKNRILKHISIERQEHLEFHKRQEKIIIENRRLKIRKRELEIQLRELKRHHHGSKGEEQSEVFKKTLEIKAEIKELHLRQHLNPFMNGDEADFNRYYRHIRFTRIFVLVFNLTLWALLFRFSGVGMGLKIVIFFFGFISTISSVIEMLFQFRIRERILKPVENLRNGVFEITQGNYEIKVNNDNTNEITSLISAFNEMAQKLREGELIKAEYEENRRALIANISHDLKTPMTSIQGYVEALTGKTHLPLEKSEEYLKVIQSNSAYMNRLIDDLFLFSKLDMQKLDFHFEEIKIRPFIEDMMEELNLDLKEKKAVFEFKDMLSQEYIVKLDAKRFFQIIRNIISNAIRYGPEEQLMIETKLYESRGSICIDIIDNGPGIPQEGLKCIFERFYRVNPGRTKNLESTGLGLAIAKELTEAHGGEISVSSEVKKGTCFTVSIPWIRNHSPQ